MRWNAHKNESLEAARGVTFEAAVVAIGAGGLLDVVAHPDPARHPGQRVLVVAIDDYVHLVPFVEEPDYLFLKTIIPSRKATRDYLGRRRGRSVDEPHSAEAEPEGHGQDDWQAEHDRQGEDDRHGDPHGAGDVTDTKGGRDV